MRAISKTCLGVIPARGSSKGVLRKNIRLVAGKPLISYTLDAAKKSKLITDFVVSTEDGEISKISASFGSAVIQRPEALAQDTTPMLPVIKHTLEKMEKRTGKTYNSIIILQPTSPLRTSSDIDQALELFFKSEADEIISVYQVSDHHPARMYFIQKDKLVPFVEEPKTKLRQELPPVYHRNGAIYIYRDKYVREETPPPKDIYPYIMPRERSLNIDEEFDLKMAELFLKK